MIATKSPKGRGGAEKKARIKAKRASTAKKASAKKGEVKEGMDEAPALFKRARARRAKRKAARAKRKGEGRGTVNKKGIGASAAKETMTKGEREKNTPEERRAKRKANRAKRKEERGSEDGSTSRREKLKAKRAKIKAKRGSMADRKAARRDRIKAKRASTAKEGAAKEEKPSGVAVATESKSTQPAMYDAALGQGVGASMYGEGPAMDDGVMDSDTEDMPIVDRENDAMTEQDAGTAMYSSLNHAPSMKGMKIQYGNPSGKNMSNYTRGQSGRPMGQPSFIKGGKKK